MLLESITGPALEASSKSRPAYRRSLPDRRCERRELSPPTALHSPDIAMRTLRTLSEFAAGRF